MSIAPTGVLSTPVDVLRTMLSQSANFQALVGVGSAAAALPFIGLHGLPTPVSRPLAFVGLADHKSRSYAGGLADYFQPAGTLKLVIEVPTKRVSTLTGVVSASVITDSSLIGLTDWFTGKQVQMQSGGAAGAASVTALISAINFTTGQITLATPLSAAPAPGDSYQIYALTPEQALVPFLNQLGAIQADLQALSGQGGYISIKSIGFSDYGRVAQSEDANDYCGVHYVIDWGI